MSDNYTFKNNVSSFVNNNVAEVNSWIQVDNNAARPLFAQASYITNLDGLTVSLTAGNVSIGDIHIADPDTGLNASVADVGAGLGALRVLTQDLDSVHDSFTIGDKKGNYTILTNSALNVFQTNTVSAVSLTNQITSVSVTNQLTGITVLNPVTSLSAYITNPQIEVVNDVGNSIPVNVTNQIVTSPDPTQLDSFNRLRVSNPVTLFDSSHRYRDNNLWATLTAVGGTYAFNQNQGLMDLTVNALSGSSVIRETTKVFAYQPGKSLLVMGTFVFAPSATNLRQRVGYYGQDNGIYFQMDDGVISLVERSLVNGSPASESIIPLSAWNGDKLNGKGASGLTLDITKAQIFWIDIEWLGVGTVRAGLIINGKFIVCHSFYHANLLPSTYITTASLPLRYEITNKGATNGSHTMKQICSTVISEGGYQLAGLQQSVGTPIDTPKSLTVAATYYPIITLRLKSTRNDAIAILTAISFIGKSNAYYNWKVIASGTTSGGSGTWISAGVDSSVEYKLDATAITGGRVVASGYCTTSTQGSTQVDILKEALFKFQLERDTLNGVNYELTLVAAADTATSNCYGSIDWEEISR